VRELAVRRPGFVGATLVLLSIGSYGDDSAVHPDVWLLLGHEPVRAVLVLVAMHVSTALITYNLLVRLAPARNIIVHEPNRSGSQSSPTEGEPAHENDGQGHVAELARERMVRLWMMWAVALEFVTGLVSIVYVPFNRPDAWISVRGEALYLAHAVLGACWRLV